MLHLLDKHRIVWISNGGREARRLGTWREKGGSGVGRRGPLVEWEDCGEGAAVTGRLVLQGSQGGGQNGGKEQDFACGEVREPEFGEGGKPVI